MVSAHLYVLWRIEYIAVLMLDFCDYPGAIANGNIYLVGVTGKFEYRPYISRTSHNEKIEYHCEPEYNRIGPVAATCVNGQWSPPGKNKLESSKANWKNSTWNTLSLSIFGGVYLEKSYLGFHLF